MDLNEKLAQRRKEREHQYIADNIHHISNEKLNEPINYPMVIAIICMVVFGFIVTFYMIERNKIEESVRASFDNYGVFLGSQYGRISIVGDNNACMVFCVKKNCQVANFLKLENKFWVVKNIDSSSSMC